MMPMPTSMMIVKALYPSDCSRLLVAMIQEVITALGWTTFTRPLLSFRRA